MTSLRLIAVGDVPFGSWFCDPDDDIASNELLNETYQASDLRDEAVKLVSASCTSAIVEDAEGTRRSVTVYDWSQIVWLIEGEGK